MPALRSSLFLLVFLISLSSSPARAELTSAPNLATAQARAKKEGRLLFVLFKSADCKHCRQFSAEVLSKEVFQSFAKDHLSLMIYDVDAYAALPEAERNLALSLEEKYGIDQMPGIVVSDPNGKDLFQTQGYRGTPAEKIVEQLRGLLPR